MSRSRKTAGGTPSGGLSLFPFLAVLICVMGGLIVLLVVLARHARVQAAKVAQTTAAQKKISLQEIHQQRELLQWQAEQIQESRTKTEAQLADARRRLSGAEDHLRKLRQELEELQRAWKALEQSVGDSAELAQWEDRLRQLQAEIVRTKEQAAQKAQAAQKVEVSYAIIPYQGPYGTQRRPVYIECRQEAVILQPEGVVLTPRDFEGPITQENPLARAMRAVREYWTNRSGGLSEAQEPYPLLLVRPDGIVAYYAAREALGEWGSEFGYELIGEDWKLKFPPADPQLAQVLQEEVQLARARQEVLAKIAPRVAGRTRPLYRVGPRGVQLEDSGSGGGTNRPGPPRFADADRAKKTPGLPTDDLASHGSSSGRGGSGEGFGEGDGGGLAGDGASRSRVGGPLSEKIAPLSEKYGAAGRFGEADGSGTGGSGNHGWGGEGARQGGGQEKGFASGGASRQSFQTGGGSGAFGSEYPSSGNMGSRMGQTAGGGPAGGFAGQSSPGGTGGLSGSPMGAGSFGPSSPSLPESSHTSGSFSAARQWVGGVPSPGADPAAAQGETVASRAGQGRRPGEWYDPPPRDTASGNTPPERSAQADAAHSKKSPVSAKELRSLRGRNWALPEATDKAIPITRPIPVQCYSDRLVIGSDGPRRKEIPLGAHSLENVDELVGAIWDQVESWGIAGRGMYWRPVLSVQVAPGAEGRFQELQTLLEDSGVLVERRR